MSENGHTTSETKKTVVSDVVGLIEDHIELASLEWQFEKEQGTRRLMAVGAGLILGLCAFGFLQIAILGGLVGLGMPLWGAAVSLAVVYGGIAGVCLWRFGHRPAQAGEPFQGTRAEIRKNLR